MTEISRAKSGFLRQSRGAWTAGQAAEALRQENEGLRAQLEAAQVEAETARARAVAEALAAEEDARVRAVEAARAEAAVAQREAVSAARAEAALTSEKAVATAREEELARGARLMEDIEASTKAAQEALASRIKTLEASLEYGKKLAEERAEAFTGKPLRCRPVSPRLLLFFRLLDCLPLVALSAAKAEAETKLREAERRQELALVAQEELWVVVGAAQEELEAVRATLVERTSALASLTGCVHPVLEEFGILGSGERGVVLSLEERIALLPARAREQASAHFRRGTQTLLGIFASHYSPLDEVALAGGWAKGVPFEQCMALEEGMADLAGKMATLVEAEIIPISDDDEEEEPAPEETAVDPPVNP